MNSRKAYETIIFGILSMIVSAHLMKTLLTMRCIISLSLLKFLLLSQSILNLLTFPYQLESQKNSSSDLSIKYFKSENNV